MNDIDNYLKVLLEFNPLYYSILALILFVFVIVIINKYVVIPQRINHLKEQDRLNQENVRLMALFAELDPDPILRVNMEGKIIHSNIAAKSLLKPKTLIGSNISEVIPEALEVYKFIETNSSKSFNIKINSKDYDVLFRGIEDLKFAQVYFHDITDRKNYERILKEFSMHLQDSIEEERRRIAKELHDGVGQNLSAARLKASRLSGKHLPDDEISRESVEIADILTKSIKELKEISYNLKPRILDEIGLEPALIALCNNFSKDFMIKGQYKFDKLERKLNSTQEICLYRIAQEALANIHSHSNAIEYSMRLIDRKNNVKLIITDNGRGFDYKELAVKRGQGRSMGLLSMRERAESIGGKFEIESSPNEGTVILVEIPAGIV